MTKYYKPTRVAVIFVTMAFLVAIYMTTLYKLQIYNTGADENAWLARDTSTQPVTLTADRGDILDRNGIKLVSTRPAYNVTLSYDKKLRDRDDYNQILLELIHTAIDNNVNYNDSFPVTIGAPFTYLIDMTAAQKKNLAEYLDYFDMDASISASDLIVKMKEHYGIDYTTNISDARLIIGVRYEMEMRIIKSMNPYVFANDVSTDFLTLIKTRRLPGVNIETSAKRVYHTTYAAHLLGYTGLMNSEEYNNTYKALNYSFNSIVGKDGVEKAFEQYLHGTDGAQVITTSIDGTVMDVKTTKDPVPGENVFLSIDIGLQEVCEDALTVKIDEINADPTRTEEDRVTGGAVVVTDVNTGEVLASASYPTYDLSNFLKNYTDLANNKSQPLFNRAMQGTYLPGSTFKMVTALAGLRSGVITASTLINDPGVFMKYADVDFTPRCWIYNQTGHGHGMENVVTALRDSCNVFFYTVGDNTGLANINIAAADFGLGAKTGIELPDVAGILADREWKLEKMGDGWRSGDTVLTAIGQGYNAFSPVQLANYVATIANGGTHYSLTILNSIRSADFTTVVKQPEHKVLGTIEETSYLNLLQQGMQEVAADGGTASSVFADFPVKVAAKTGTVQTGITNAKLNNGVFVCYAPADDPQIAIALVVEKGQSGSTIMEIAKDIMLYYFKEDVQVGVAADNTMMP